MTNKANQEPRQSAHEDFKGILKEAVEEALNSALEHRARIEAETHAEHHAYVAALIQRERDRNRMYRKIAMAVAQWSVLGIISWAVGHFQFGLGK